ncbi:MAG: thioredoxin family protein [Bacteroidales bacterium]|nr:thioredoxin family protein [Bacteroidales bacterium]
MALLLVHGGLKPGDKAASFSLKSVNGDTISLSDYSNQKGVILVFTSIPCPFSKAYEQRIIDLHNKYASLGFPVVAINSNSPEISPEDSFSHMKLRTLEKGYPFSYLKDEKGEVCKAYGATRTPHVYLLDNSNNHFKIAYMGAIDDNSLDSRSVSNRYLENALRALSEGERPDPATTRPIGCIIKTKGL